jgi:transketolase
MISTLPRVLLLRPADQIEVSACYAAVFTGPSRPAVLCFSREATPVVDGTSFDGAIRGGYVIKTVPNPKLVLIGTGTDLARCIAVAEQLPFEVQIDSMPCMEIFDEQDFEWKRKVLPAGVPIVAVEAGISYGWAKYAHKHYGVNDYGISAKPVDIYDNFNLTVPKLVEEAKRVVAFFDSKPVPDILDLP